MNYNWYFFLIDAYPRGRGRLWLNPIENWFAKLQRHVVTNGNFSSVKELENKIKEYIDFYNSCLFKPLNWKFKGFSKDRPLLNYKVSKT